MRVENKEFSHFDSFDVFLEHTFGSNVSVAHGHTLDGSCISDVHKVSLTGDSNIDIIVKKNCNCNAYNLCLAEARGIRAIALTNTIRVPEVMAIIESEQDSSLILSYIDSSNIKNKRFWQDFGTQLAQMHGTQSIPNNQMISHTLPSDNSKNNSIFGFPYDNFIGSTPQINTMNTSWIDFFRIHRLWFQFQLAQQNGYFDALLSKKAERLCNKLDTLIQEPHTCSLLHGDLWAGNYICDNHNNPVLIDPAVYYGHYEADLAMTELFGGYPAEFYNAYSQYLPLDKGYHNTRKIIYNLYHLLNHLNLFGASYLGSVKNIIAKFV